VTEGDNEMRAMKNTVVIVFAALAVLHGSVHAAGPPDLINYQGVLRSAAGVPQDGDFDMVFRFFDADVDGNEVLVDEHLDVGSGAVTVTGGLFNVALGSGSVADGSGPGSFSSLGDVFRRLDEVYLEVQVEGEVLAPRTRIGSAAYSIGDTMADPPCFDTSNRFVNCGNGTVTDTATGLIWLEDANCTAVGGFQDWASANEAALNLGDGTCGLTDRSSPGDWRLPTKAEWEAIIDAACNPSIPDTAGTGCWSEGDAFSGVQSNAYWSSSSNPGNPTQAWRVSLSTGDSVSNLKTINFTTWPVRSAP